MLDEDGDPVAQDWTAICWMIEHAYADGRSDPAPANARLIAAAPDLLAALQAIVTTLGATEENDGHKELWRNTFDAIARATGTDQ